MTIWKPMRNICISLPEEIIITLDEIAKKYYCSRAECIRRILAHASAKLDPNKIAIEKVLNEDPFDPRLIDLDDS